MKPVLRGAALLGLGVALVGPATTTVASARPPAEAAPTIRFTDATEPSGVAFVHENGAAGHKLLPETMGAGVAVFDFDRDGDQDLLFVNSSRWPDAPSDGAPPSTLALYANDGAGRFRDVTAAVGLDLTFYGQGIAIGEADGDGWPDVYVTAVGPNRLLLNREGRFEDATARAGVAGGEDEWGTGATFFDADGDGDLDLFVCNYLEWSPGIDAAIERERDGVGLTYGLPQQYRGVHPRLFRNDGAGRFTDVSEASGVRVEEAAPGGVTQPVAKALAVAPIDVDRDGRVDLFVANDTSRNFFFHNRGPVEAVPFFEEAGEHFGLAFGPNGETTGAMGVDGGHLDESGDLALVVGNFALEASSAFVAQGDPTFFADEAMRLGLGTDTHGALTFGLLLFDADLDGRLDLLQVNGHVESDIERIDPRQSYRQPAQLFRNLGGTPRARFELVAASADDGLARPLAGRGAATGDLDGDGDLDLVLTEVAGPARVLRNDVEAGRRWLRVRLEGPPANPDGIGARIELEVGGRTQVRWIQPTRSYLSQVETPATFGLGDGTPGKLVVTWPDGAVHELETGAGAAGTELVLTRSGTQGP